MRQSFESIVRSKGLTERAKDILIAKDFPDRYEEWLNQWASPGWRGQKQIAVAPPLPGVETLQPPPFLVPPSAVGAPPLTPEFQKGLEEMRKILHPRPEQEPLSRAVATLYPDIVAATQTLPTEQRLTQAITSIQQVAQEDMDAYLEDVVRKGRSEETDYLLTQLFGATPQDIEVLFGGDDLETTLDKVMPGTSLEDLDMMLKEDSPAFVEKMQTGGRTKEKESLLKMLGVSEAEIDELFGDKISVRKDSGWLDSWLDKFFPPAGGKSLRDKWRRTFVAGIGDVIKTTGGTARWLGFDGAGTALSNIGSSLQRVAPPDTLGEFDMGDLLNPDFYVVKVGRTIPFALSLLPLAIGGFGVGSAVATAVGLGRIGALIVGSFAGAALSRPLESALEAGGAYDDAIARNKTEAEAKTEADEVFKKNMLLGGSDAFQIAIALAPTPKWVPASLVKAGLVRTARIGGKTIIVGLSQGGEEVYQDMITRHAKGEEWQLDPISKEVFAIGMVMGGGMGLSGDLISGVVDRAQTKMSDSLKQKFKAKVKEFETEGFRTDQSELKALDEISQTPEGEQIVGETIREMGVEGGIPEEVPPVAPGVRGISSEKESVIRATISNLEAKGFMPEVTSFSIDQTIAKEALGKYSGAKKTIVFSEEASIRPNIVEHELLHGIIAEARTKIGDDFLIEYAKIAGFIGKDLPKAIRTEFTVRSPISEDFVSMLRSYLVGEDLPTAYKTFFDKFKAQVAIPKAEAVKPVVPEAAISVKEISPAEMETVMTLRREAGLEGPPPGVRVKEEIAPEVIRRVPLAPPGVTQEQQAEYTRRMTPYLNKADTEIQKVNDDFMAGKSSLAENQAQRDIINLELDKQANKIRREMGFPETIVAPPTVPLAPPVEEGVAPPLPEVIEGATGQEVKGAVETEIYNHIKETAQLKETTDVVQKLTQLIEQAEPIREITEGMKHEELSKRTGRAAGILRSNEGREAFQRSKSALKGELPKADFAPPELQLTDTDIKDLFNKIRDSDFRYFEQLNTAEALETLLSGNIPTRGEIKLLENMFGSDLAKAILSKRTLGMKIWENTLDALNLPRAVLASWDLSAPLRQGAVLFWGQPLQSLPALKPMLQAFASEKQSMIIDETIKGGKYADLRESAGLYQAPLFGVSAKLTEREETFMSRLAHYIPIVKRSERAYVTYLNKLRADVFDSYAAHWEGTNKTMKDYKELATFINRASGRGNLGALSESAPILSAVFFSPRYQASRITLPISFFTATPAVRTVIARNIVAFVGANLAILTLLKLAAGADVEDDPRSADFGKGKIGSTRFDFWAGFQQYARAIAQVITGMRKVSTTGRLTDAERADLIAQFVRSKLSPIAGLVTDIVMQETFLGEELAVSTEDVKKQAYEKLTPMFIQDLIEAVIHSGIATGFMALPGLLGVGIQTYGGGYWTDFIDKLGQPQKTDTLPYSAQKEIYTTKNLWSDTLPRIKGVPLENMTDQYGYPELIKAIAQTRDIKTIFVDRPSSPLVKINADITKGDTFELYYLQWQEYQKAEDKEKWLKDNPDYDKYYMGNFSRRALSLLREYHRLDKADRKKFLNNLSEEEQALLTSNPRTEWLKSHPKENAQLAIFGQAKILTQAAYDEAQRLIKEFDIPDAGLPDLTVPPELSIEGYIQYQEQGEKFGYNSWEVQLIIAKDDKLKEFLGRDPIETPVGQLELQVKLRDMEKDTPEYIETSRRVEAYQQKVPEDLHDAYVEYYEIPTKGYGNERFLMENRRYYEEVWLGILGNKAIDFTKIPSKAVETLYEEYQKLPSGKARKAFRKQHPDLDEWGKQVGIWEEPVKEKEKVFEGIPR